MTLQLLRGDFGCRCTSQQPLFLPTPPPLCRGEGGAERGQERGREEKRWEREREEGGSKGNVMQQCAVQTEEAVWMPITNIFPSLNTHTVLLEHCACNIKPMNFKQTISSPFHESLHWDNSFTNTVQMQFNWPVLQVNYLWLLAWEGGLHLSVHTHINIPQKHPPTLHSTNTSADTQAGLQLKYNGCTWALVGQKGCRALYCVLGF